MEKYLARSVHAGLGIMEDVDTFAVFTADTLSPRQALESPGYTARDWRAGRHAIQHDPVPVGIVEVDSDFGGRFHALPEHRKGPCRGLFRNIVLKYVAALGLPRTWDCFGRDKVVLGGGNHVSRLRRCSPEPICLPSHQN